MFADGAQEAAVVEGSRAPEDGRANVAAPLGFVSWNIHGAVGTDRMCAPKRIARVLQEIDADVVALQEVPLGGHAMAIGAPQRREECGRRDGRWRSLSARACRLAAGS